MTLRHGHHYGAVDSARRRSSVDTGVPTSPTILPRGRPHPRPRRESHSLGTDPHLSDVDSDSNEDVDALTSLIERVGSRVSEHNTHLEQDQWAAHKRAASRRKEWREWANDQLGVPDMVYVILVITLSTSMLDAVMFTLFGTFTTNQTGNTVFLTLAVLHQGTRKLQLAAMSLMGFVGAGLVMGQLGAYFGHRRRAWIITSLSCQVLVLFGFCLCLSPLTPSSFDPEGEYELVPMFFSAIQGGAQVVMATNLGVPETPSAMVTSAYAALLSDPLLTKPAGAVPRDRRIVYLAVFWIGSFLGLGAERLVSAFFASCLSLVFKIIALVMVVRSGPAAQDGRVW